MPPHLLPFDRSSCVGTCSPPCVSNSTCCRAATCVRPGPRCALPVVRQSCPSVLSTCLKPPRGPTSGSANPSSVARVFYPRHNTNSPHFTGWRAAWPLPPTLLPVGSSEAIPPETPHVLLPHPQALLSHSLGIGPTNQVLSLLNLPMDPRSVSISRKM